MHIISNIDKNIKATIILINISGKAEFNDFIMKLSDLRSRITDKTGMAGSSFLYCIICGGALIFFYLVTHNGFSTESAQETMLVWSNALTLIGALLLLITAIRKLSRIGGLWDWFSYSFYLAGVLLTKRKDHYTSFYEYTSAKEHSNTPLWPWIVIGAIGLAFGCGLAVIYEMIYYL